MFDFTLLYLCAILGDKDAVIFPPVKGYNLNLQETTAQSLLDDSCSRVVHTGPRAKIICFSTKDFGESIYVSVCLYLLVYSLTN